MRWMLAQGRKPHHTAPNHRRVHGPARDRSWETCQECIRLFYEDSNIAELLDKAKRLQDTHGVPGEQTMGVVFRRLHAGHNTAVRARR